MPKSDYFEMDGTVTKVLPGELFEVEVESTNGVKNTVLCKISGKLRQNFIRILLGDSVVVDVSPYDPTRGRITWRGKKRDYDNN